MFQMNFRTSPFTVNWEQQTAMVVSKINARICMYMCAHVYRMRAGQISVTRLCILNLSKVLSVVDAV